MSHYKGGYVGRVLRVDLSAGTMKDEPLPGDDVLRQYIGGWGLGLRILYDMLPPGYTATDPENPLVFMTGPLTGLRLPGATNITLATKNFDTGFTVGRSHTHGAFGGLMKSAGYDGVIITGKSDKPLYLWLHDGKAELRDASHLWGCTDSHEAEEAIKAELGGKGVSVAAIGPAGENLVTGAMICNDHNHSFSHSGVGSVMGSKKLKAIAVSGKLPIPVADADAVKAANKAWITQMQGGGHFGWDHVRGLAIRKGEYRERLKNFGFCGKNFTLNQLTEFGLGWAKQEYIGQPCPRCPISCCYDVQVTTGPHKGYVATLCSGSEVLEAAGAILGITEVGAVAYIADLYDRLGIECSLAGSTIAMAIEAYERGLITKKETGGLELRWGDDKVVETLLRQMAKREGFGAILALGTKRAAEAIGGDAPSFAVNIKGSGMNMHDWRSAWGVLFGQIVGAGAGWPAPGADYFTPEPDAGYPERADRYDIRSKPMEAKKTGIIKFMEDSTGFCWFITWGTKDVLRLIADSLNAATGYDYTPEELLKVGERTMHLERAFNVRHGLKPEDDWTVPARIVDPPADGPAAGLSMKPYLMGMVKEYHRLMGWDEKTGKPMRTVLKAVDLDDVIKDLWE